jgi:hypothetical protein
MDVKDVKVFPFPDLPVDLQRQIAGRLSFRDLAQLACLSKQLRAFCTDRVRERDGVVAVRLESEFTPEFREGLSPAQTALPRDLVVDPQVRGPELALPWTLQEDHVSDRSNDHVAVTNSGTSP